MFCTLFLLFFTSAYSLPCLYMYFYPFPSRGTYYETLILTLMHDVCAIHIRRNVCTVTEVARGLIVRASFYS